MTTLALAARQLLTAELVIGRRCAICGEPTGRGGRRYCGREACKAQARYLHRERRIAEQVRRKHEAGE